MPEDSLRKGILVVLIGAVIGLGIAAYHHFMTPSVLETKDLAQATEPKITHTPNTVPTTFIFVQVEGSVLRPGVYKVPKGMRVMDLLKHCGLTGNVDLRKIGLAKRLKDGQKIVVPEFSERKARRAYGGLLLPISIAAATEKSLVQIPGMSPSLAKRIVTYRDGHVVSSIDDLLNVKGIKEKQLDNFRPYLQL